jgi:hypothetical protein
LTEQGKNAETLENKEITSKANTLPQVYQLATTIPDHFPRTFASRGLAFSYYFVGGLFLLWIVAKILNHDENKKKDL